MKYPSIVTVRAALLATALLSIESGAETLSDVDKEKRWADQVIETLFDGEVVWLTAAQHQFLALEMASDDGSVDKALIVVHGIGVHPNWEQVVRPVRVEMAASGWNTLSIQMPVLRNEANSMEYEPLFDEVTGRFSAAIDYLRDKGAEKIVIVAHSLGAAMSSWYLSDNDAGDISALVIIGMSADTATTPVDTALALRRIELPVLDIYGSEDLEPVRKSAAKRASAAYAGGNSRYRQTRMEDADHFFDGHEEQLLKQIGDWLQKLD